MQSLSLHGDSSRNEIKKKIVEAINQSRALLAAAAAAAAFQYVCAVISWGH
jgi:hypothetical protein